MDPELVIHGNARGADQFAHDWAVRNERQVHVFPAKWRTGRSLPNKLGYDTKAGHDRNGLMLDSYPNIPVLAFPFGVAKGTRDCIAQAIERWHEVKVYDLKGGLIEHHLPDAA
jgi:hypothetical protein